MVLNAVKEPFATYRVVVHLWFMVLNNSCFLSIWYNWEEFLRILSAFISVIRYVIQVVQLYFLSNSLFSVHTKYLLLVYSIGVVLTLPNSDLSNMAELPSFSPPASESTLQYRTSPLRQAHMRPKLKAAPVHNCDYRSLVISVLCNPCVITKSLVL